MYGNKIGKNNTKPVFLYHALIEICIFSKTLKKFQIPFSQNGYGMNTKWLHFCRKVKSQNKK